ncbi:MAG: hypothetical protein ACWGMT_08040 [Burkholderiales bacterium]
MFSPRSAAFRSLALLAAAFWSAAPAAATELSVRLDRLEAPGVAAGPIDVRLMRGATTALELNVGEISLEGQRWRNVRVSCADFSWEGQRIECRDGVAEAGTRIPLSFKYHLGGQSLEVVLWPSAKEAWTLKAQLAQPKPSLRLEIRDGMLSRLAPWLPALWPKVTAGFLSGVITLDGTGHDRLAAQLALREVSFSDASGLHAAEKLGARLQLAAQRKPGGWDYQASLDWTGGELFWQPLFLRGAGYTLTAEGTVDEKRVSVAQGEARLAAIGGIRGSAIWDRKSNRLERADVESGELDAAGLYSQVMKPFFFGTALGELRVEGKTELAAHWRDGQLHAVEASLRGLSFEDVNRRFAVFDANGRVPWHRTEETAIDLDIQGGELLRVPFGRVKLPLTMRGMRFRLDTVEIPLLDGKLTARGFAIEPPQEGWRWAFRGALSPVSMEQFTNALGLPAMHGTISAEIPRVRYAHSTLEVDGAVLFKVFDGTVLANNVRLIEPFGQAPRLAADLEARNIDLDLLTRTFSFGSITGRVDAEVNGLELANWRPVKFNARLASSAGDYPRKISQRAVENITALGGAGAAAAIQGTFLRFFDQFGYEKLGVSCRLENGVCTMGGIENRAQGYVIVKGGGIPALSVLGYNRTVDWAELVDRLKRVIQNNIRMIVQ